MNNPRRPYFNSLATEWDRIAAPPHAEGGIAALLQRSHVAGVRRVLDVGCGTGILVPELQNIYGTAACLVECDFAEEMLKVGLAKYPETLLRPVCADAQALPFSDATFDLAICFGALPHMPDKPAALRQILRVLRPGGVLCVGHLSDSSALNEFHRSLDAPVAVDVLPAADALARMLKDLGAAEIESEEHADWYFVRATRV